MLQHSSSWVVTDIYTLPQTLHTLRHCMYIHQSYPQYTWLCYKIFHYLMKNLQCDWIDHVVNNDPEDIITIVITAPRVITEGAVAR